MAVNAEHDHDLPGYPGLPQLHTFFDLGYAKGRGPCLGKALRRRDKPMPIGIGLDHGKNSHCRANQFSHLPEIMAQGATINLYSIPGRCSHTCNPFLQPRAFVAIEKKAIATSIPAQHRCCNFLILSSNFYEFFPFF
jgi:hypothetical protein